MATHQYRIPVFCVDTLLLYLYCGPISDILMHSQRNYNSAPSAACISATPRAATRRPAKFHGKRPIAQSRLFTARNKQYDICIDLIPFQSLIGAILDTPCHVYALRTSGVIHNSAASISPPDLVLWSSINSQDIQTYLTRRLVRRLTR